MGIMILSEDYFVRKKGDKIMLKTVVLTVVIGLIVWVALAANKIRDIDGIPTYIVIAVAVVFLLLIYAVIFGGKKVYEDHD